MKAVDRLKNYRNKTLGLPAKVFRDLKQGKDANVPESVVKKYPFLFVQEKPKGVKEDGN